RRHHTGHVTAARHSPHPDLAALGLSLSAVQRGTAEGLTIRSVPSDKSPGDWRFEYGGSVQALGAKRARQCLAPTEKRIAEKSYFSLRSFFNASMALKNC